MKNLKFNLFAVIFSLNLVSPAHAEVDGFKLPNISLLETATVLEIMNQLKDPNNRLAWICVEDIRAGFGRKPLTAECRSEVNKALIKDTSGEETELMKLAVEITKDLSTDLEKATAIYEWITKNIRYDVESYTELVKTKKIFTDPLQLVAAKATLDKKMSLSEGYSLLTAAMLRAVQIPAVTIIGLATKGSKVQGVHTWNEAYVNGRWINLDTTWDSGNVTGNLNQGLVFVPKATKVYFDMPDSEFKKTHQTVIDIK